MEVLVLEKKRTKIKNGRGRHKKTAAFVKDFEGNIQFTIVDFEEVERASVI